MNETPGLQKSLRSLIADGVLIPVVGAGISQASAGIPGWRGVLKGGIEYARGRGLVGPSQAARFKLLQKQSAPSALVEAATLLREALTGSSSGLGEYPAWLKHQFDVPRAAKIDGTIYRLLIHLQCTFIATTNYDTLLERSFTGWSPVTRARPNQLIEVLQDGARIVHLHGVWDEPETVVFGETEYSSVCHDPAHADFMKCLWMDKQLLFIGCSVDGMSDPDFLRLVEWFNCTYPNSTRVHYALVKEQDFQRYASEFLTRHRIRLLPYGLSHADLPKWLSELRSQTVQSYVNGPRRFFGRTKELRTITRLLEQGKSVSVSGMGGIGKTELAKSVANKLAVIDNSRRLTWIEATGSADLAHLIELVALQLLPKSIPDIPDDQKRSLVRDAMRGAHVFIDDAPDLSITEEFLEEVCPPNQSILVTSRRVSTRTDHHLSLSGLDERSARQLFVSISGDSQHHQLVSAICTQVEQHPLSIQLIASRRRLGREPLSSLLDRLNDAQSRFNALTAVGSVVESRENSVRASIEISFEGLDQAALNLIFACCTCDSAVSIPLLQLTAELDRNRLEDLLADLIGRSLLERTEAGSIRVHMLIRAYVRDRWNSEGREWDGKLASAGVKFCLLKSEEVWNSRTQLVRELSNFLALARRAEAEDLADAVSEILQIIVLLCEESGPLRQRWLLTSMQELIAAGQRLIEIHSRRAAEPMYELLSSEVALMQRDYELASERLAIAREKSLSLDDKHCYRLSLSSGGKLALSQNDLPQAVSLYSQVLDLTDGDDLVALASAKGQLAHAFAGDRDLDKAQDLFSEADDLYSKANFLQGVASTKSGLAKVAALNGNPVEARQMWLDSLEIERRIGDVGGALQDIGELISVSSSREQLYELIAICEEIERNEIDLAPNIASNAKKLSADCLFAAGEFSEALERYDSCLEYERSSQDIRGAAVVLGNMTNVRIAERRFDEADVLASMCLDHYRHAGDEFGEAQCSMQKARISGALLKRIEQRSWVLRSIEQFAGLRNTLMVDACLDELSQTVLPADLDRPPRILSTSLPQNYDDCLDAIRAYAQRCQISNLFELWPILHTFSPGGLRKFGAAQPSEHKRSLSLVDLAYGTDDR